MTSRCNKCGTKIKKNGKFCYTCGNKIEPLAINYKKENNTNLITYKRILGITISSLMILLPIILVTYLLIVEGPDFGKYGANNIFPGFNATLAGRKTEFQKNLKNIIINSALSTIIISIPSLIIFYVRCGKKGLSNAGDYVLGSMLCSIAYTFVLTLLILFDFTGIFRILTLIFFYIIATAFLFFIIISSKKLELNVIFSTISSLILGCLLASLLTPFIGVGILFLGDLFWILLLILLCCSSGGGILVIRVV